MTAIGTVHHYLRQSLFSNAIFIALAGIVPALLGYLFWTVATRFASPHEVGIASTLLSVTTFITLFTGLDLGTMLIRYLPQSQDPARLVNSIFLLRTLLALLGALVFVGGLSRWTPELGFLRQDALLLLGFVLSNALFSINDLIAHIFIAYRQALFSALHNTYVSVLRFVPLGLGILWASQLSGVALYGSIIVGVLLVLLLTVGYHFRRAGIPYRLAWGIDLTEVRQRSNASMQNFVGAMALQAPALLLPVMAMYHLGAEASAVSYIVLMVAGMAAFVPQAIARSLFSEGMHEPAQIVANLRLSLLSSLGLSVLMLLATLLLGEPVLRLSFGPLYAAQGSGFLLLLILAVLPTAIIHTNLTIMRLQNNMLQVAIIGLSVGLLSLLSMFPLLQSQHLTGAGLGYLLGHGVGALLSLPGILAMFAAARQPRQPTEYSSNHKILSVILDEYLRGAGAGSVVLDVGCGTGSIVPALRHAAGEGTLILGTDVDISAVQVAQREHPQAQFFAYDGYTMPLASDSVAYIVAQEVLEHVPDAPRFMASLARVLKPGGMLLITTPNQQKQPLTEHSHPDHVQHFHQAELLALARGCGLELVDAFYRTHPLSVLMDRLLRMVGTRVLPTYELQAHMLLIDNPEQHFLLRFYDRWIDPGITWAEQLEFRLLKRVPAMSHVCIFRKPGG